MKVLITALALLSFLGASTLPVYAAVQPQKPGTTNETGKPVAKRTSHRTVTGKHHVASKTTSHRHHLAGNTVTHKHRIAHRTPAHTHRVAESTTTSAHHVANHTPAKTHKPTLQKPSAQG